MCRFDNAIQWVGKVVVGRCGRRREVVQKGGGSSLTIVLGKCIDFLCYCVIVCCVIVLLCKTQLVCRRMNMNGI